MPRIAAHTRQKLQQVLSHFGIDTPELHDIRSGRVNKHWRVQSGADRYVLRRYNHHRSPEAIQYEHEVLRHIERKGWPVAVPLPAEGGATFVMHGSPDAPASADVRTSTDSTESAYSLFPFLPGRPGPPHNPRYLRIKGALLARLHRDLAALPSRSQRDGFGRLSDLDAYVPSSASQPGGGLATFDARVDAFGREQPRLAEQIRIQRQTSLDELARLGYHALPDRLVHADFHTENIFFYRRRLTALLDFDLVHLDARVADIACAIAADCPEPPAYMSLDSESVRAYVAAYHAESPLSEQERGLIVPLVCAYYLWLCGFGLNRWVDGDVERARRGLARTVDQRLPNLAARAPAIEKALRIAAASKAGT